MINALLATKKNMTSTYDARGRRVGATILEVQPNIVTQIKTTETKDGYKAVQLGYGSKKSTKQPQTGLLKKLGSEQKVRWMREVRTQEDTDVKPGQEIKLSQVFSVGDSVKVTATSKGKGFQGGVRRHGFAGGPKTHGQSDRHRAPGSVGQTTTPGRVYRGKRMAGHMGLETSSTRNLEVVAVDRKNNLITVKGAVPGVVGGLVTITKLGRIKGYIAPPEPELTEEELAEQEKEAQRATEQAETTESTENAETTQPTEQSQPAEVTESEQPADAEAPQDATEKEGNPDGNDK